ncbi:aminotransferase class IV [Tepidimicrobium xylanilyticum]|uniref:Branched-chain amino acid aminotransferase n=1 Tax=Tepidimicrobium xylanilyticum TaxID=1123352 RepID=A0A1H2V8P5_9FIRM|nr:aminotransferase class IV [Tepidimicrobium xylanilyticum]GMG96699.1 branched-chain amino acid aminotransferase [Tepidimicrobium xylanilyticum]SDW64655.1 branched-chain amino acid aminotransferase [Tepidimicrobium xylanilyticum]
MKPEAIREYLMVNGRLEPTSNTEIFEKIEKPPIYEVIRVIDGVPLFLEDHLDRMRESARIIDYPIKRKDVQIEEDIKDLIIKNGVKNLNVKLLCTDIENMGQVVLAYFIKSFYPPEEYYEEGIHTILFNYERENPNAKIQMLSFREEVARKLEENNAFEALLVNKDGYIPEGSRSNIFFVKGENIYTAPKGDVLLGITRKYIFQVCEELNIEIVEENIHKDDLIRLDGAFMSGTSVNVLPISSIDNIRLDSVSNKIIKEISKAYINKMREYIESRTL